MSSTIKIINITRKRVLVAPLDWGLGHTTRCIPIIQELLHQDFIVLIAAEGSSAYLLSKEFPSLTILSLKGYQISYSNTKVFFKVKLFGQIPKILKAIKQEHTWLKQVIKEYKIDIVVSDNRYGLYNSKIKNIFITHQLAIETGNAFTNWLVQKLNYRLINKFDECWIPDEEAPFDLAGKLSHPKEMPVVPTKYIGILSRFKKNTPEKNIDLLVLISGPEPQRTALENLMLLQMTKFSLKMVLVRGLPGASNRIINTNKELQIFDHLPATELNKLIQSSKIVIARSGYSTIMDLIALQQRAILIPTPGQTEQEYLAEYLSTKKYFVAAQQKGFNLVKEIKTLEGVAWKTLPVSQNKKLQEAIICLK